MSMKRVMSNPKFTKQRKRTTAFYRGLGLLFLLLLLIFVALWGRVVTIVSNVQFLSKQEVNRIVLLEGILLKNENVLRADVGGKLHLVAADGSRLESGAKAAQVFAVQQDTGGEAYDILTPAAGICCTHLDGLEQILTPDSIDVLTVPKIEKIGDKTTSEGIRVDKGQPVLKIIDNLSPVYFFAETPKSDFPGLNLDKPKWLQAEWEGRTISAKPFKMADKGDRWQGYYLLSAYPDQLLHQRRIRLNITAGTLEGFLVPQKAIVNRNGQSGIFLSVKKKACWAPVTIEGELQGMIAVSGPELTGGTRYVNNPLLVREGHRVE